MGNLTNLKEVSASVLPARVLVLLSKYAQALRVHNGMVLKISSVNVFKNIYRTYPLARHPAIKRIHAELLAEVNMHLEQGTMHTNESKRQATELALKANTDNRVGHSIGSR